MVATAPGAPKTSNTTCLGLNATMLFSAPLGVEVTSREPKMPFSRYTANPATTTTSTATSSIHRRLSTPPNETRCIPDPFDERRHVDRRWDASSAEEAISTKLTVRYRTGLHKPYGFSLVTRGL